MLGHERAKGPTFNILETLLPMLSYGEAIHTMLDFWVDMYTMLSYLGFGHPT